MNKIKLPRKRRSTTVNHRQPTLVVMNLAEMGPKPDWQAVQGFFGGLQEKERAVLLHWLAFHLGSARAAHEHDPLAPANYRDHCCGRSAQADELLMELRALIHLEGEKVGAGLREYFGGKKAGKEE